MKIYTLVRGGIRVGDNFTKDFIDNIAHYEVGSEDRLTIWYFVEKKNELGANKDE